MKGICFKEELFNAVIEGRKTQTRRIIVEVEKLGNIEVRAYKDGTFGTFVNSVLHSVNLKPRYIVGDTVYLKEPYYESNLMKKTIEYKYNSDLPSDVIKRAKWANKLFMPERYARYFIKITSVRCERLQEISDEDCLKEGIEEVFGRMNNNGVLNAIEPNYEVLYTNGFDTHNSKKKAYAALIDKINGKNTWQSNPFVFVYDFELIKK